MFLISHMTSREHMFKGLCGFMAGGPSRRVTTLPHLIAIGQLKWRWWKLLNMSRHPTKAGELYEWELFIVCHHPAKFVGHRYCSSRDIIFLVCDMIKQDQVIKGLGDSKIGASQDKSPHCLVW